MTTNTQQLVSPFPYFGGKRLIAAEVWRRFGDVENYVEPFFGSGAVLLGRTSAPKIETINDVDCMICNFWRAVKYAPDEVSHHADWPVNEKDMHARNLWLISKKEELTFLLEDPEAFDAKIAGWWMWGMCIWIGRGWTWKKHYPIPSVGNTGQGLTRRCTNPDLDPTGILRALSDRLRLVRVCCGDWKKICTPVITTNLDKNTAVFLDPPYGTVTREIVYGNDGTHIQKEVAQWCIENTSTMKIAVCGYDGEYNVLEDFGWEVFCWTANGGYSNQGKINRNENRKQERIWFSPKCKKQARLF